MNFTRALFICLGSLPAFATVNSAILVSSDWLSGHLRDEGLVILHVGSEKDFDTGHSPGARLVTVADISVTSETGLRLEVPPMKALEDALRKLGISEGPGIIVYAGNDSVQSATRVWFTLDYAGLGDKASLLDGGLAAWKAEGKPLSTDKTAVTPGKITIHPKPDLIVDAEWVRTHLSDSEVMIVDARTAEFYSGANAGGMPRAGHIPGALNVTFSTLLAEHGKLRPVDELRELMKAGAGAETKLRVSYCHIGQQATVVYFVARYLGLNVRLYDGSFQDWSRRTELPVELK